MIPHLLPEVSFTELAKGVGDLASIRLLHDAQQSKHSMLLYAIAGAADGTGRGPAAFQAAYELLARMQATDRQASDWLLGLPHLSGWVHDCLIGLERGTAADFGHFACLVAAAAVRAGVPFDLEVPVRDGRVRLPGLGSLHLTEQAAWTRMICDGECVTAGHDFAADCRLLAPDEGTGGAPARWSGTPIVRALAGGLAWNVLLETSDPYLDRYKVPMSRDYSPGELPGWRRRIQSAWDLLVRHHRQTAEPMAESISVIVPLAPLTNTDLVSATSPAAFGAIATSWPPDPVTLAETLVHEFQHVKLCGLLDMVPLTESGGEKVYAPWRDDPRPAASLLQGIYAHLAVTQFWRVQQHAPSEPDDILRAQVNFARWRPAIGQAARALTGAGCLTPAGMRFVAMLQEQGQRLEAERVPLGAQEIADEAALDHRLTWQLRHVAFESAKLARLAAAYQQGEPFSAGMLPRARIEEDTRKVGPTVLSRLLAMRYRAPDRYRELCAPGVLPLSAADMLLISGNTTAAIRAYRDQIAVSTDPQTDAWIGLALALHRGPASPLRQTFAAHLALMFDLSAFTIGRREPLALAGWLA